MTTTVTVPTRYQGPPDTANGGYVAGLLAVDLGPAATVRLEAAVPLETPLRLETGDAGASLWDGEQRVAVAAPHDGIPRPGAGVDSDAAEATVGPTAEEHTFPHCFVCGPSAVDGLHITPGPLPDGSAIATTWIPDPAGADLDVDRLAWAALDCPSGLAVMAQGVAVVLGTMTAQIDRPLEAGEPLVVVGRHTASEGRKRFASTTLYDADGEPVAWSEAVWITLPS